MSMKSAYGARKSTELRKKRGEEEFKEPPEKVQRGDPQPGTSEDPDMDHQDTEAADDVGATATGGASGGAGSGGSHVSADPTIPFPIKQGAVVHNITLQGKSVDETLFNGEIKWLPMEMFVQEIMTPATRDALTGYVTKRQISSGQPGYKTKGEFFFKFNGPIRFKLSKLILTQKSITTGTTPEIS